MSYSNSIQGFHYQVFGLKLQSDIEFPELMPISDTNSVDIYIKLGQTSEEISRPISKSKYFVIDNDIAILKADEFHLVIEQGTTITVCCNSPELSIYAIRLRVMGAGLGLLMQQRGMLVLHAATLVGNEGGVLILGNSGDGKSTLVMQLIQSGYKMLGDDKCVVMFDKGQIWSLPTSSSVKIKKEAISALNCNKRRTQIIAPEHNKLYVDLQDDFVPEKVPLLGGFVLAKSDALSTKKLSQRDALGHLFDGVFRKKKLIGAKMLAHQFHHCHQVATSISLYEYSRSLSGTEIQPPEEAFLRLLKELTNGNGR